MWLFVLGCLGACASALVWLIYLFVFVSFYFVLFSLFHFFVSFLCFHFFVFISLFRLVWCVCLCVWCMLLCVHNGYFRPDIHCNTWQYVITTNSQGRFMVANMSRTWIFGTYGYLTMCACAILLFFCSKRISMFAKCVNYMYI